MQRWNAGAGNLATIGIMVANAVVFIIGIAVDQSGGLNAGSGGRFAENMGLAKFFITEGEWWRLFTSGFLHFGVMHIAFNMFGLYRLGSFLEPALGRVRFLLLYLASLLAGSFGVIALQSADVQGGALHGGASGAVFGLLGALAVAFHQRGVSLMKSGLGVTLLINVALTVSLHLSIGAHLGGFIGGAIAGWFLLSTRRGQSTSQVAWAVPIAVCVVSVVGSVLLSRV
jgi:membrane associated rhomboid family serine protease